MLKQRFFTAVILVAVLLSVILFLPPAGFALFVAVVCLFCAWEWARLAEVKTIAWHAFYQLLFVILLSVTYYCRQYSLFFLWGGVFWWCLSSIFILNYPALTKFWAKQSTLLLLGVLVLLPTWVALLNLRSFANFSVLLIWLFFLVAAADIGAYFTGRAFGRNKLAVEVSPNKTWEGFFGGMLASIFLGVFISLNWIANDLLTIVLLSLGSGLIAVLSVIGDLLESMVKRHADVKDSSKLLPGHGGVLDRLDSLVAAAPAFALMMYFADKVIS